MRSMQILAAGAAAALCGLAPAADCGSGFNVFDLEAQSLDKLTYGEDVAGIEDITGDGFGDVLVGDANADAPGFANSGAVWIYSGATGELFGMLVSPSPSVGNGFGFSLAVVPDTNGDGFDDIAVAEYHGAVPSSDQGRVVLFSGATREVLWLFDGFGGDGSFGTQLVGIPSINGDDAGDVAVGSWNGFDVVTDAHLIDGAEGTLLAVIGPPRSDSAIQYFPYAMSGVQRTGGQSRLAIASPKGDASGAHFAAGRVDLHAADGTLTYTLQAPTPSVGEQFGSSIASGNLTGNADAELLVASDGSGIVEGVSAGPGIVRIYTFGAGEAPSLVRTHVLDDVDNYAIEVAVIPDRNGDGYAEYAIAQRAQDSSFRVLLFDGATGVGAGCVFDDPLLEFSVFTVDGVPDASGDDDGDILISRMTATYNVSDVSLHFECGDLAEATEMIQSWRAGCFHPGCGDPLGFLATINVAIDFAAGAGVAGGGAVATYRTASVSNPGAARWWKGFNPQPDPPLGITAPVPLLVTKASATEAEVNDVAFNGSPDTLGMTLVLSLDALDGTAWRNVDDIEFGVFTKSDPQYVGLGWERYGTIRIPAHDLIVRSDSPCPDAAAPQRMTVEGARLEGIDAGAWTNITALLGGSLGNVGTPTAMDFTLDGGVIPPGDECGGAVSAGLGFHPFSLDGATSAGDAVTCSGGPGGGVPSQIAKDVWFRFVAPCNATTTFSTCDLSETNTKLAIYLGADCAGAQLLGCSNNACSGLQSSIDIVTTAGETYLVRLGAVPGAAVAPGVLGITTAGSDCPGTCPEATWVFHDSVVAWIAAAGPAYSVFATVADNIVLAEEVDAEPATNAQLGPVLTFLDPVVVPHAFRITALQDGAGITFSDHEGGPFAPGFEDALSIGDIDNFEDDDWSVEFLEGAPVYGFGATLGDSSGDATESFTVHCQGGTAFAVDTTIGSGTAAFVGVTTDTPITRVVFDEGAGGDDIAISALRFLGHPPCPGDVNGSGGVDAADLGLLLSAWGPCPEGSFPCGWSDLNQSGTVDAADLGLLLSAWGTCG